MIYWLLLPRPDRIRGNLRALELAGQIDEIPTLFQVFMGVLYMRYRILFRSDTVGVDRVPLRQTPWARRMAWRPLRAPFLIWEQVVAPFDLTGFPARPDFLVRHLVGAYHPGENAQYDLSLLAAHPGYLDDLQKRVSAVVADPDHWYRDLVVYEGYHERLLTLVDRALQGDFTMSDSDAIASDASLRGFVRWCCAQPMSLAQAFRAARRGELSLRPSRA